MTETPDVNPAAPLTSDPPVSDPTDLPPEDPAPDAEGDTVEVPQRD